RARDPSRSLGSRPTVSSFAMRPVTAADRPVLERLWQLYRHDLSEFRGEHGPAGFRGTLPDASGGFKTETLVPFLRESAARAAYLFLIGASPVGFALVGGVTSERLLMSEFFVVRGARRQGVARAAVHELFSHHRGTWELAFQENNAAAARFWRRVAAEVAGDAVLEERRPVPDKPQGPPDVWITITVA